MHQADRQPRVRACTGRAGTGGARRFAWSSFFLLFSSSALQLPEKALPLAPRPPRTVTHKRNTAPSGALFSYASSRRWSKGRSTAASACLYGSGGYGRGCGTRREPIHGGSTCAIHGARRSRTPTRTRPWTVHRRATNDNPPHIQATNYPTDIASRCVALPRPPANCPGPGCVGSRDRHAPWMAHASLHGRTCGVSREPTHPRPARCKRQPRLPALKLSSSQALNLLIS